MYKICFGIVGGLSTNKFIRKKEIAQLENFYLRLIDLHPGCEIFYFGHDTADYTPSILEVVKVIDQDTLNITPDDYLIKYALDNSIDGVSMLALNCIANYSHVTNFIGYNNETTGAKYLDCIKLSIDADLKKIATFKEMLTEKQHELDELKTTHVSKSMALATELATNKEKLISLKELNYDLLVQNAKLKEEIAILKPIDSTNDTSITNSCDKIDLVIPYVNSSDQNWVAVFNRYSPKKIDANVNGLSRFRGQGEFFRYVFRSIEQFMPWINKVILLVQSESQVPAWINRDTVTVITHDKFIPSQFLPTFNSCTIEMFLWNIPDLSEKFIYINDDFYATKPLDETSFFDNNKVKLDLFKLKATVQDNWSLYMIQCLNNAKLIFGADTDKYAKVGHAFRPYLRSKMEECYKVYEQEIIASISRFRTDKNFNCYIYSLYLEKIGLLKPTELRVGYTTTYRADIFTQFDTLCINDTGVNSIYDNIALNKLFFTELSDKSKYEVVGLPKNYVKYMLVDDQRPYLYF